MRILCPGCGAEYAIPDNAIPAAGREVQCAACAHAWYQLPAFHPAESLAPAAVAAEPAPQRAPAAIPPTASAPLPDAPRRPPAPASSAGPADPDAPDLRIDRLRAALSEAGRNLSGPAAPPVRTPPVTTPRVTTPPAAAGSAGAGIDADAEDADESPAPAVAPLARRIDPGVLDILREEAAFEARARAGGPAPVLRQPADPPPMRLTPAQERLARLQQAERDGGPLDPADSEAAIEDPSAQRHGPRPPLIRPSATEPAVPMLRRRADGRDLPVRIAPPSVAAYRAQQHRKGFRLGYGASVGLCCGLLTLYLGAPQVARWLPAGTPLAERVIDHGDRVQAALVGALRAMLDAGAS